VTGGSRGIGRAVAIRLAAEKAAVVVGYVGSKDAAEEVVEEITTAGGTAVAVQVDVADEDAVTAMFDLATERFGGVDVVVNLAGKMTLGPIATFDVADFDDIQRVNLRGTFLVAREAARRMRDGGSIILVSTSVLGLHLPTYAAYAASKGGVEAITPILARELRGRDITVNTVAPGPTATDLFLNGKDEATIERMAKQPPLERLGTPDDIAGVVAFLTGPAGHWVNAQVVRANGGII
jgi:3-oxoacyl-[acyl-carrier protein] reductase